MYLYSDQVRNLKNLTGEELVDRFKTIIERDAELKEIFDLTNISEVNSWRYSLPILIQLIGEANLENLYLTIEYGNLASRYRMDAILTGYNKSGEVMSLIIELKQWSNIDDTVQVYPTTVKVDGINEVRLHPIEQTDNYVKHMKMFHSNVVEGKLKISAIQYLHNFDVANKNKLFVSSNRRYLVKQSELFCKGEEIRLKDYLQSIFKEDDIGDLYKLLIDGTYVFGDEALRVIEQASRGERFITLLDEQISIADEVVERMNHTFQNEKKLIVIISGDPGTGKSILGLELLRRFCASNSSRKCCYTTPSRALKLVLKGYTDDIVENTIEVIEKKRSKFDFLVIDEAHRLPRINNLIKLAINNNKMIVILQDDSQRILASEEGTIENIESSIDEYKVKNNHQEIEVIKYKLNIERRISSTSNYGVLVSEFLNAEPIPSYVKSKEYMVGIVDDLYSFEHFMNRANQHHHCKILAPFCWEWSRDVSKFDIEIKEGEAVYRYPWNPAQKEKIFNWYRDENKKYLWQVGCCYTSQGLEYDYVGLIFWDDMKYDGEKWIYDLNKLADPYFIGDVVRRYGGELKTNGKSGNEKKYIKDNQNRWLVKYLNTEYEIYKFLNLKNVDIDEEINILIKNIYRILLTRATKGIIIWFKDETTKKYFKKIMNC